MERTPLKPAAAWPFPTTAAGTTAANQVAAVMAENEFVRVPGRTFTNGFAVPFVVPDFFVGKFLTGFNDDGSVSIGPDVVPTVRISYFDAAAKCAAAGVSMLTLAQSAVLALDVAEQAANWSGGAVGVGKLMQGLHLGTVSGAVAGTYVSPKESERRGFVLSTGEVVDDVAGHLFTWLRDDIHGDERGLVAVEGFPENSPVVSGAPFPSMQQGVGYYPDAGEDWSGNALFRGGCWYSNAYAGVFRLNLGSPGYSSSDVGVRCTKPIGL
ncbi:MAG: hypothetical protein V4508_02415 [Pseudomonadota bacterium]